MAYIFHASSTGTKSAIRLNANVHPMQLWKEPFLSTIFFLFISFSCSPSLSISLSPRKIKIKRFCFCLFNFIPHYTAIFLLSVRNRSGLRHWNRKASAACLPYNRLYYSFSAAVSSSSSSLFCRFFFRRWPELSVLFRPQLNVSSIIRIVHNSIFTCTRTIWYYLLSKVVGIVWTREPCVCAREWVVQLNKNASEWCLCSYVHIGGV